MECPEEFPIGLRKTHQFRMKPDPPCLKVARNFSDGALDPLISTNFRISGQNCAPINEMEKLYSEAMRLAACLMALMLAGCQSTAFDPGSSTAVSAGGFKKNTPEWRGEKFANNRCSSCHSVGFAETSPLPNAPSFSEIANTRDLTAASLAEWMENHENYPDEMYFQIPEEHIDDVVAYMVTLRRSD